MWILCILLILLYLTSSKLVAWAVVAFCAVVILMRVFGISVKLTIYRR